MVKEFIKRIFRIFGFEIRRISSVRNKFEPTRLTMEESLRHILSLNYYPEVIIDVGAADGTPPLLNVFPKSKFLWVEPIVEFENALKKLSEKYDGQYLIAAAGRFNGEAPMRVPSDKYGSTLSFKEAYGDPVREVKVIRLDDLIDEYKLEGEMLLKVDVQGFEMEVLEGTPRLLQFCDVVILEVSFFRCAEGRPDFYDIVDYMKKKGFVVYDIFEHENRLLDKALDQTNLLFVKEAGRFRQSHKWAAEIQ